MAHRLARDERGPLNVPVAVREELEERAMERARRDLPEHLRGEDALARIRRFVELPQLVPRERDAIDAAAREASGQHFAPHSRVVALRLAPDAIRLVVVADGCEHTKGPTADAVVVPAFFWKSRLLTLASLSISLPP